MAIALPASHRDEQPAGLQRPQGGAQQPLEAVVMGAGKCLEAFDDLKSIFVGVDR